MEDLKLLIEMVAGLPSLAIWVLVGYLFYKIAVIGSIYGLLRFGIDKLHNWLTTERNKAVVIKHGEIGCINMEVADMLRGQLLRLSSGSYTHQSDVSKLKSVIDRMESEDKK